MVLVFGVDVPLVEMMLMFSVITLIILVEVSVIMVLLLHQLRSSRKTAERLDVLSRALRRPRTGKMHTPRRGGRRRNVRM